MLTELVADQVAPAYWVPNKDVEVRTQRLKMRRKSLLLLSWLELLFLPSEIRC